MKNKKLWLGLLFLLLAMPSRVPAETGTEAIIKSGEALNSPHAVALSASQFVTIYEEQKTGGQGSFILGIVGTVANDLSITYGTPFEIIASSNPQLAVTRLSDSQFVVFFKRSYTGADSVFFFTGTIQGAGANATLSHGKLFPLGSQNINSLDVSAFSANQWLTAYIKDDQTCCVRTTTLEADSIRLGAEVEVTGFAESTSAAMFVRLANLSASKFLLANRFSTQNQEENQVMTGEVINPDSLVFGTPETFLVNSTEECDDFGLVALTEDKFIIGYSSKQDARSQTHGKFWPFRELQGKPGPNENGQFRVKAGSVNGNNISFGDEAQVWDYPGYHLALARINDTDFAAAFTQLGLFDPAYVGKGLAIIGEVEGTSINWHGKLTCINREADHKLSIMAFDEDKMVAVCNFDREETVADPCSTALAALATALGEMTYSGSTVLQEKKVLRGFPNQIVLQIQVEADDPYHPVRTTRLECNLKGTSNVSDITQAKLWYSEWSTALERAQPFGDSVTSFNGNFTFTDDVPLAVGINNFWLTCDIADKAELGNLVDGECISVTVNNVPETPVPTAPDSSAVISMPRAFRVADAESTEVNGLYIQAGQTNNKPFFKKTENSRTFYLYSLTFQNMDVWLLGPDFEIFNCNFLVYDESGAVFVDPPATGWKILRGNVASNLTVTEVFENSLIYSKLGFSENIANDGSIDNNTPVRVTYVLPRGGNAFSGSNGDDFVAANKVNVANLPTGLTAVVTRQSDTTATISLTGKAIDHTVENSVYDLSFTFKDDAFLLGKSSQINFAKKDSLHINFLLLYYVQDAGTDTVNGVYYSNGHFNNRLKFVKAPDFVIYHLDDGDKYWVIGDSTDGAHVFYKNDTPADTLPETGWQVENAAAPAPTVTRVDGPPTMTTATATEITAGSATCGGIISNNGGAPVTECGVCWGLSANPSLSDSTQISNSVADTFSVSITGLASNTTYHVRAYAKNIMGTGYGVDSTFTTEMVKVRVTPADTLLRGNQSLVYQIKAENVYPGLRGFEIKVGLDTTAFSSIEFTEGTFLSSTASPTHWQLLKEGGNYTVSCAIIGTTTGQIGDGTLFTIAATTESPVPDHLVSSISDNFRLTSVKLRNVNNLAIPCDSVCHGKIVVDTGRPTMETITETEEVWYRSAPTFANFGFDDNFKLDIIEYRVNSEAWATVADTIAQASYDKDGWEFPDFDDLVEQTTSHTLHWRGTDAAGNVNGYFETSSGNATRIGEPTAKPDIDIWDWTFKKDVSAPDGQLSISIDHVSSTSMLVNAASLTDATQGDEFYLFDCPTDSKYDRSRQKDDTVHECSGMTPNTQYSFRYRVSDDVNDPNTSPAYNATPWSSEYSRYTLSVAPTTSNVTCNKTGTNSTTTFTFTAVGGFGAGLVQYYRYILLDSTTHVWTGKESQWNADVLQLGLPKANTNYYLHLKGYNAANVANGTLALGPYAWDGTPISPITALELNPSGNSLEFTWKNPQQDAYKIQVWIHPFGGYPQYTGNMPNFPQTPAEAAANGWINISEILCTGMTYAPSIRDFYYVVIFVEDRAAHFSVAASDSSLSYWLGDVNANPDGVVNAADIAILAAAYQARFGNNGWNPFCDVGPTLDFSRTGRPLPDGLINFEDLMIFAMNYENTGSQKLKKPAARGEINPITLELNIQRVNSNFLAQVQLNENAAFVKGLEIPLNFGPDVNILSVQKGSLLSDGDFFHASRDGYALSISSAALENGGVFDGDGVIANITFQVNGTNTAFQFGSACARTATNAAIEVNYNYTDVELLAQSLIPTEYKLHQNFPNPFNPQTTIRYDLKENGPVKITLYNINGQFVATLLDEEKHAGYHSYVFEAGHLPSGVYMYKIEMKNFSDLRKLVLIK